MIRKILYIVPLFLLFLLNQKISLSEESILSFFRETIVIENSGSEQQINSKLDEVRIDEIQQTHCVALCISNRIHIASERCERQIVTTIKLLESLLQKEQNILNKISETLSINHSLKFSSLRIRSGHWVYVLRKIII